MIRVIFSFLFFAGSAVAEPTLKFDLNATYCQRLFILNEQSLGGFTEDKELAQKIIIDTARRFAGITDTELPPGSQANLALFRAAIYGLMHSYSMYDLAEAFVTNAIELTEDDWLDIAFRPCSAHS